MSEDRFYGGLPIVVDERVPNYPPWNGMVMVPSGADPETYLEALFGPKADEGGGAVSENKQIRVYKDNAGEWRWKKIVSSDETADSAEGYKNKGDAVEQANSENDGSFEVIVEGAEGDA